MNRIFLLLILMGIGRVSFAQYVYTIKADSVKITNTCDTAELIIENHTQTVPGFLYNKGKGRTEFRRGAIKLNDSMYLVGADTIKLALLRAENGASLWNGKIVLGNDPGGVGAMLLNTREVPLNGHNVIFTGNGKVGIGTSAPRDLLELGTPIASLDTATANLRFSYTAEPDRYSDLIWNRFTGNAPTHQMGFSLTHQNTIDTPLILTADSKILLTGYVKCTGGGPDGPIDLENSSTYTDANMIILRFPDHFHYHVIKSSFNGAWPSLNKIQFFLSPGTDATGVDPGLPTVNPLNLLGDGNSIFNGNIGIQNTSPSAYIHIGAGASTSGSAPIKLTAGTILSTPENGAIEFDGTDLYLTENTARYKLAKTIGGQLTTNFGGTCLGFKPVTAALTVVGSQPGDVVSVSANSGVSNSPSLIITAYVTSANTVTLQAYNASGDILTIAADTYKVRVIK